MKDRGYLKILFCGLFFLVLPFLCGAADNPLQIKPVGIQTPKVELYVTDWCPYCAKAISFLRSRGIPYVAYDIEKDRTAAERMKRLSGQRGVPFAIINGQKIYGFSEKIYKEALGIK